MAYYLYDTYGGYYRLDHDWYAYDPTRKNGHWDYNNPYNYLYFDLYYRGKYGSGPEYGYDYYDYSQYDHETVSDEALITVHQLLQDNKVVLFALTQCSSCRKAMEQLDGKHIPYLVFNIDTDPFISERNYLDILEPLSGIRNVPQLFIYGQYYGDGAKIRNGLNRGDIQRLCRCGHYSRRLMKDHHRYSRNHGYLYKNISRTSNNANKVLAGNDARFVVQKHLQNNAVVLFALSDCDSCTNTESLLFQKQVPFKVFYIDADPKLGMNKYLDTLESLSNNRNLPQLYIQGKYYGDSQKIRKGLNNGELQRLCNCGRVAVTKNQQRDHGLSVKNKAPANTIQKLLQDNKVVLFVFTNCIPCMKVMSQLEKQKIHYKEYYIDQDPNNSQAQYFDALEFLSGIRTVPQLFIEGRFYGDSEKVQEGISSGEVQRLSQ